MANPEYMHARELGLRAMSIETSACVGEGACCTSQVPISKGDIGIMVKDIHSGKISREVIDATIERGKDPERSEQCPFLDIDNKCSIYESRPLVCITWGIGGELSPMGHVDLSKMIASGELEETGSGRIRNMDLNQATCLTCRLITAFDTTSIEANNLASEANNQVLPVIKKGRDYTTTDFVKNELPYIQAK
ncbi:MAG: YkgJ family cysteine cluster protein [Candidatus Levyibacteriota bacterium]